MNRSDLIRAVADHLAIPKDAVEQIVETMIEVIEVSLACGENVTIHQFGRFEARDRAEVTRIHPGTGEKITVPPKKSVLFHAAPHLKERVNRK